MKTIHRKLDETVRLYDGQLARPRREIDNDPLLKLRKEEVGRNPFTC
jgi:hypothetical protein